MTPKRLFKGSYQEVLDWLSKQSQVGDISVVVEDDKSAEGILKVPKREPEPSTPEPSDDSQSPPAENGESGDDFDDSGVSPSPDGDGDEDSDDDSPPFDLSDLLGGGSSAGDSGGSDVQLDSEEFKDHEILNEKGFIRRIKSILKDNLEKRENPNKEYGKLDFKRLHKVLTQKQPRVFKKREKISEKGYELHLILDASASMRSDINVATACCLDLAYVFDKIMPVTIQIFGSESELIKDRNKFIDLKNEKERKAFINRVNNFMGWAGGGTHLLDPLEEVEKLISSKEKGVTPIIIIISDGDTTNFEDCSKKIKKLEKAECKVCAIGLGSGFKEYKLVRGENDAYGMATKKLTLVNEKFLTKINRKEELFGALSAILKRLIKRRSL